MKDLTAVLLPFLERMTDLEAAYIFGSHAEGTAGTQSDIDIALLFKAGREKVFYLEKEAELSGKLNALLKRDDIDVVVLNSVRSSELKYSIVHDGRLIFDRCHNLAEYELRVEHEYHDHLAALRRAGLTKA